MSRKIIMAGDDIRRTLARIAHEIIERNKVIEQLILVGIHTRGVPLSKRLAANIKEFSGVAVAVGSLTSASTATTSPAWSCSPR